MAGQEIVRVGKNTGGITFTAAEFAFGQRIGLTTDTTSTSVIQTAIDQLSRVPGSLNDMLANVFGAGPTANYGYDPSADWLVGISLTYSVLTFDILLIDGQFYGLLIKIGRKPKPPPKPPPNGNGKNGDGNGNGENGNGKNGKNGDNQPFAGLSLEILYRKVNDHLGEWSADLTLPGKFRNLTFGEAPEAITVTLPAVGVAVWTNGDFKVSVGWPLGMRSFNISFPPDPIPWAGGGGLYFAKLRSEDAAGLGTDFDTIVEFGIGLRIGAATMGNYGIVNYAASLYLFGTFQGFLAWEQGHTTSQGVDYYWFCATVGITAHLEAGINLEIIAVSLSLDVTASATLAIETDHSATAQVEFKAVVTASVRILFFTVSLSYTLDLQTQIQIGSGPPALITGPSPPTQMAAATARLEAAPAAVAATTPSPPAIQAHLLVQPTVRYDAGSSAWKPAAVATLVVDVATGVAPLAESLAAYVLSRFGGYTDPTATLTAAELSAAQTALEGGQLDLAGVYAWLNGASASFTVTGATTGGTGTPTAAVLPVIPGLTLTYNGVTTTFGDGPPPAGYLTTLADYLAALSLTATPSNPTQSVAAVTSPSPAWAPGVVFADAFNLLARQVVHDLQGVTTPGTLAAGLAQVDMTNLAGVLSRFLQHGLRLPDPATSGTPVDLPTLGLYELTGQQFDVASGVTTATVGVASPTVSVTIGGGTADLPFVLDQRPETGPLSSPAALPRIQDVPLVVMLQQGFGWTRQATAWTVFDFPEPLQSQLRLASPLTLELSTTDGSGPATPYDGEVAMLIRFSLQPIAGVSGVYQVAGTDDATRDLMELLFASGTLASSQLDLLLPVKGGGSYVTSAADANALLLKIDLSSTSKPQLTALFAALDPLGPTSAALSDVSDFLLLLWECSVVHSGGFFLCVSDLDTSDGAASYPVAVAVRAAAATPQAAVTVEAYHTSVLCAPTSNRVQAAVVDSGVPVTQPQPGYPAGTVAFGATWTASDTPPVPAAADAADTGQYAAFLYQLLQYRLDAAGGFDASPWSMPVGPNGDATAWSYSRAVPVQRFLPGAGPNRYAAIGRVAQLDMQLVDVFGNAAPGETLELPVVYNDALVAVDEWPGVRFGYAFSASGNTPTLTLTFTFDPTEVVNKQPAYDTFGVVVDQLTDPRATLTVTSALAAGAVTMTSSGATLQAALTTFAAAVQAALSPSTPGAPPDPLVATGTVDLGYVGQIADDLFPVWVSLELARTAPSENTPYPYPDGFLSVVTQVPLALDDNVPQVALRDWAIGFEAAFAGFDGHGGLVKLLAGSPPSKVALTGSKLGASSAGDVTSVPGDLWALRWSASAGVGVTFPNSAGGTVPADQAPAYFTAMPLSTQLVGGDAAITSYDPNGNPVSPTTTQTFSGVDLDGWASEFLAAFDALLAPQNAAALARADGTSYAALMKAKEQIADAIAAGVSWVFADQMPPAGGGDGLGNLTDAQTVLGESLLTALGADFATSAIVQVPATVSVAGAFEPDPSGTPQLYGSPTPQVSAKTAKQFTISSATLPVAAGPAMLSFLVGAVSPTTQADLSLPFDYDLAFLDHYFQTSAEQFGYTPSTWLRIVVPDVDPGGSGTPVLDVSMGTLDVPIPLRAYPSPPRLVRQAIVAAYATPTLAQAAQANYELTVAAPTVSQDDLHLALLFNGATEDRVSGGQAADALLAPLAQFRNFQAPRGTDQSYLDTALAAIAAGAPSAPQWYAALLGTVQAVADAWGAGSVVAADAVEFAAPPPLPAPFTWDFRVQVRDESKPNVMTLEWTGSGAVPNGAWPLIEGAAGTPVTSTEYTYTLGSNANLSEPTLTWQGLSVITVQSLTTAAWIVRNETLAGTDRPTNPGLLYSTATVSFAEPVVPLLEVTPTLSVSSTSLSDALGQLVGQVVQPTTPASEVGWGVECSYSFTLLSDGGEQQLRTSLPVFLARSELTTASTPPPGTESVAQLVAGLEGQLASWYSTLLPAGTAAALGFTVTVFASHADQPLLRLADVEAAVGGSGWWT